MSAAAFFLSCLAAAAGFLALAYWTIHHFSP